MKKFKVKGKTEVKKEYPERDLPVSDEYTHFDASLPESKTGKYGFREIKDMFYDKHLSNFEIKSVFNIMDRNKGIIFI